MRLRLWAVGSAGWLALLLAFAPACGQAAETGGRLQKRWLFVWRDMTNPAEVDRVIARLPQARAAGYNGLALSYDVAPSRAAALKQAAKDHGLDLIAIVMGNPHDRNYMEGVPVKDALFVARGQRATLQADNPTRVLNGDFEEARGNRFARWSFQDDEGVTTFADRAVVHGGQCSLRIQDVGRNKYRHARLFQPLKLQPHRQYRITVWVRTADLSPADCEIKVLSPDTSQSISFQTFRPARTQDWKRYDLVFNSLGFSDARLYLGSWWGQSGKMWLDDLSIEEIGLVNALRRPGCPVTVRGDDGTAYEEGRDYQKVVDPQLHPWRPWHEEPPIKLPAGSRIKDGDRLRVSYYHSLVVYEDRLNGCLTEPRILDDWRAEVKQADERLHPAAFFMSHDELRVINHCALCQSKGLTPGGLLAANVRQAAQIIREARPDAEIWVWNDMFDPLHNAVDRYYAVNGSLKGSWEGLDKDVGIVNWHGGLKGKNCPFFANLGLRQILSGYYDGDEDGSGIAEWLRLTKEVPGIVGAMYTTWEDKYGAMDAWAKKAWGGP